LLRNELKNFAGIGLAKVVAEAIGAGAIIEGYGTPSAWTPEQTQIQNRKFIWGVTQAIDLLCEKLARPAKPKFVVLYMNTCAINPYNFITG
jgi:hypothetical protein